MVSKYYGGPLVEGRFYLQFEDINTLVNQKVYVCYLELTGGTYERATLEAISLWKTVPRKSVHYIGLCEFPRNPKLVLILPE